MNVIALGKCCFPCVIPMYWVGQHERMTVTTLPLRFLLRFKVHHTTWAAVWVCFGELVWAGLGYTGPTVCNSG